MHCRSPGQLPMSLGELGTQTHVLWLIFLKRKLTHTLQYIFFLFFFILDERSFSVANLSSFAIFFG